MDKPLWQPSKERIAQTNLTAFMQQVEAAHDVKIPDYPALYEFSVAQPEKFWQTIWSFGKVIAKMQGKTVLAGKNKMPGAQWFPQAKLNYAENLLRRKDAATAIVFWGEDRAKRKLSHADLYAQVSKLAQALRAQGIQPGDRIAAFMPNMPETIIAMLAATSIGAVFSSASPDFGVQGVLDRFGQIEPKILFAADGYFYNGKTHDSLARVAQIAHQLPSLQQIVIVPYTQKAPPLAGMDLAVTLSEFTANYSATEIRFEPLPFDHPLYILYSSGTTGVPKCIVHGAGGTLLQ
ncbi:MAG: AMP-binding protein, partial [Burkholderiales bacterium]